MLRPKSRQKSPDHRDDRTRRHEGYQSGVKRLVLEIDIVLLQMLFGTLHELHGNQFEAAPFEPFDYVAHESALHAIRFHHDKSPLRVRHTRELMSKRIESLI